MFKSSKNDIDIDNYNNNNNYNNNEYKYIQEPIYQRLRSNILQPSSTQWIHEENQVDDHLEPEDIRQQKILEQLLTIPQVEQKSEEWFALRNKRVTASDTGCVIGDNHYELPCKFIYKKVRNPPFESNMFCHHGTKYEHIATMIYAYRMNVEVKEFGLLAHPTNKNVAASPDGIVGKYKADGIHLTKYVGRMVEIKCVVRRKINTDGPIKDHQCPLYYWDQVQQQLECCNLEKCDFWQCEIKEYDNRKEFIEDTHVDEPFRSKETGHEKGCIIQLMPLNTPGSEEEYDQAVWGKSKYIYPPRIDMTPHECDIWIAETMASISTHYPPSHAYGEGADRVVYGFDRVIWWRLVKTHCVTIDRDREWFKSVLPRVEEMWGYVLHLRENKELGDVVCDYIEALWAPSTKKLTEKNNDKVLRLVDIVCGKKLGYEKAVLEAREEIERVRRKREFLKKIEEDDGEE